MQICPAWHESLDEVAAFINTAAIGKRSFCPITSDYLTTLFARDPAHGMRGMLLAIENDEIVGLTHALIDKVNELGYIPYLLAKDNKVPILNLLLESAEQQLSTASRIEFSGTETPLYHTVEGRFQPLWGSTEMLEVNTADCSLLAFLQSKGYRRAEIHVSYMLPLSDYLSQGAPSPIAHEYLVGDEVWYNAYNWYKRSSSQEFGLRNKQLRVIVLRAKHYVSGHIAWYPMRDGLTAALCDLEVVPALRGRGLGRNLLRLGLDFIKREGFKRVELHTLPKESPVACKLYESLGFTVDATWHSLYKGMPLR